MKKRVTLSLCMIVKDEERTLERCLNSVKSFINEIIIVDTGSKDKTKEIAKGFNAKIYDFKWINDFAAARNFSFRKATSDYILWLDGDDFINSEDITKIENLLEHLDTSYDYISGEYILARNNEGKVSSVLRRNRIVKREKNFKWIGKVHEYLAVYGRGLEGDFAIEHGKIKAYTDRNFQIFKEMEKKNEKFSPRDMYYYANELMDNGHYKEAIDEYRKFIETNQGWIEDVKGAYFRIINCYKVLNEKEKVPDIVFEAFKIDAPTAEIVCSLAEYFFEKNNINQAIFWYRTALDCIPDKGNPSLSNSAYYTWIPSLQLCVCYYNLGKIDCSYFFNELTATFMGDSDKVVYNRKIFKDAYKRLNSKAPTLEYPLKACDYIKYI